MAVDLTDLIPDLQAKISPPGENNYPNATEDDFLQNLRDGFWDAFLDGFMAGFTEADGLITPTQAGSPDMTRDFQQIVIFYAGYQILLADLRNYATLTNSKAGPTQFEQQRSATVIRALLQDLQGQRNIMLRRLSDLGYIPTGYIDAVIERTSRIQNQDIWWTAGRSWQSSNY